MFETHVATVANVWERVVGGSDMRATPPYTAAKTITAANRGTMCTVTDAWTSIVNNTHMIAAKEEMRRAQVFTPEEAKRQQRYGVGCDLLKKMGWSIEQESHRRMGWETQAEGSEHVTFQRGPKKRGGRLGGPGLGLGRCNATSVAAPPQDNGSTTAPELSGLDYLGTINATTNFWVDGEDTTGNARTTRTKTKTTATMLTGRRTAMQSTARQTRRPIDATMRGAVNLVSALPDLQEHNTRLEITSKSIRGRRPRAPIAAQTKKHLEKEVGVRESKHAFSATCNMAHAQETQTDVDTFREAGKRWRGEFPNEQLLKRCHDETHPSFPVTWRRVIRATGIGPGLEQNKLKKEGARASETRNYSEATVRGARV